MVDLPAINNVVPQVHAPQTRVGPGDIAQPYNELAANLDKAGETLSKTVAEPLARRAGLQSVTRDAAGNIQIEHPPIVGDAATAWARGMKEAAVADADVVARLDDVKLRQEHRDDPKGYLAAATAYQKEKVKQYGNTAGPEVGFAVGNIIAHQTAQTFRGLSNDKESRDLHRIDSSLKTQMVTAAEDAAVMARGGVVSGPDFDAAVAKYHAGVTSRANNPLLRYSREAAEFDTKHFHGEIGANLFLHDVDQVKKSQGAAAALKYAQTILTDRGYTLSLQSRESYYHKAVGEVRADEAIRRQNLGDVRAANAELMTASALGLKVDPDQVEQVAGAFRAAGDLAAAARVYASFARKPLNDEFGRQPLAVQTQQLSTLQSATRATTNTDGQPVELSPEQIEQLHTQGGPAGALWLQANRARAIQTQARGLWKTIMSDWEKEGIRPPDQVVTQITAAAHASGDHVLLDTVAVGLDRMNFVQGQGRQSLPTQGAAVGELARRSAAGELAPGQAAIEKDLQRKFAAITTGLAENPITTTVTNFSDRFKMPGPLDVTNEQSFVGGLQYRGQIAGFAAQNWQTETVPALDRSDLSQVRAALAASDPRGKARIYSNIATALPSPVREATFAKLGASGPEAMVEAYAGALYTREPSIAESILRGQAAIKTDKRFDPRNEGEKKDVFNAALDKALPESAFSLAGRTNPIGAYATMRAATTARYADLLAQDPNAKKEFTEARLQQAATDVTGGIFDHNGGKIIAPRRGLSQRDFDRILGGLAGDDVAGVTTLDGKPVTADYLRSTAQLESRSDGTYYVKIGSGYAVRFANTESPDKFVLDLRNRAIPSTDEDVRRVLGGGP